jgi:hypothetical protein
MFRRDRNNDRRAGGVAFYISSKYASKRRNDLEYCDFQLLFVEVKINSLLFICSVCYRPTNYNSAQNIALLAHLQFCLDEINQIPGTSVLLFGDFNANFIVENALPSGDFGSCLYRLMARNSLFQVITTHFIAIYVHSVFMLAGLFSYEHFFY